MRKKNGIISAFTLIELLVVIAIIGILVTLVVISLQNVRKNARDIKRIADIKQLQLALELYIHDNGFYPPSVDSGGSLSSGDITYMEKVPQAPIPPDGDCDSISNEYSYIPIGEDNSSYTISFCLGNNNGGLPAGKVVASPQGLGEDLSFWTCGENLLDSRDNQYYATKQYGNQCWFVENLNIGTFTGNAATTTNNGIIEKYCYNNIESNCGNGYGGLYQWNEAMNYVETERAQGICPDGWHIPTSQEWDDLYFYINTTSPNYRCNGISGNIGKALAFDNGWASDDTECHVGNNISTNNATGFNGLPSGWRIAQSPDFNLFVAIRAYFWSSSGSGDTATYRHLGFDNPSFYSNADFQANGFSIRCIKD